MLYRDPTQKRNSMATQKPKIKQEAAESTLPPNDPATPTQPVVHTLAMLKTESGHQVIRILTQGPTLLGFVRESADDCAPDIAYDKVKILSVRYYQNRQIFSAPIPEDLETSLPGVVHSIGVVKTPDGKYIPVSMRIDTDSTIRVALLFSSPLALGEAVNVYKKRVNAFFLGRKLFVE